MRPHKVARLALSPPKSLELGRDPPAPTLLVQEDVLEPAAAAIQVRFASPGKLAGQDAPSSRWQPWICRGCTIQSLGGFCDSDDHATEVVTVVQAWRGASDKVPSRASSPDKTSSNSLAGLESIEAEEEAATFWCSPTLLLLLLLQLLPRFWPISLRASFLWHS